MPNPPPIDFEKVVSDYYEGLYRFAYSLAKAEDPASDLTQETFLIFARKRHTIKDPSKTKSWLFTTLYREFLKQVRREKPISDMEDDALQAIADPQLIGQARQLQGQEAMEILQSLDPVFREPLSLFYLEGYPYKEIADILDIPIGTVMSRLSRGKDALKQRLLEKSGNKIR